MRKTAFTLILLLLFLFCGTASAASSETVSGSVSAEPLWTEEMTTQVSIAVESETGFGQGAQLTAGLGNGLEAAWERAKLPVWWHFSLVNGSTGIILTRMDGQQLWFEAERWDEGNGVTVFRSPDSSAAERSGPIYLTDPDLQGRFALYFGFDLGSIRRIDVSMCLQLTLDRQPDLNGCGFFSGLYPLTDILFSDGMRRLSLPSPETGMLVPELPVDVFCSVSGRVLKAGEASFVLLNSEGKTADSLRVNAEGLASVRLDTAPLWAFDGTEGQEYTLKQTTADSDGTSADGTVYLVRVGEGSHASDGDGWTAVRPVTLLRVSEDGETEIETIRQEFHFHTDPHGSLILTRDFEDNLWAEYTNVYDAAGSVSLHGYVRAQERLAPVTAGEFVVSVSENGEEIGRTSVTDGGAFSLPAIEYTLSDVGTHTYAVAQIPGNDAGIEYDTAERYVSVEVTDAGKGVLSCEENVEDILFINRYTARGTLEIEAVSVLDGRALRAGEFEYALTLDGRELASGTNDAEGRTALSCDFTGEFVHAEGEMTRTFTAQLNCRIPEGETNGLLFDAHTENVTVTLTDDGHGVIEAAAEPGTFTFSHQYTASGSLTLEGDVTKAGQALRSDVFVAALWENGHMVSSAMNDENGHFVFSAVPYSLSDVGTHVYTAQQYSTEETNIELDGTVYTVTAVVSDGGNGVLNVSADVAGSADGLLHFTNRYTAAGTCDVQGTMTLTGGAIVPGIYGFELKDGDEILAETAADAQGAFTFESVPFTLDDVGRKTLTVSAKDTGNASVTAGQTAVPVTLAITDRGDGTLAVTAENRAEFAFVYAASGSYTPSGTLSMTGRTLRDGEISFRVTENGTVVSEGTGKADGSIVFTPIEYVRDDIGTHLYQVRQASADPGGVSGESGAIDLAVTVTDLGEGVLSAADDGSELHFVYTYEASGTFAPEASVTLKDHVLVDGQFTFEILLGERVIKTQTNDHTGNIAFYPFTYTLEDVGTHTYSIRQAGEDTPSIKLDRNVYALEVTVNDNGNGTLQVLQTSGPAVFTNVYGAQAGLLLEGTVTMEGRALADGELQFEVLRGTQRVSTGTSKADGSIAFTEILLTQEDLRDSDGVLQSSAVLPLTVKMLIPEETAGVVYDTGEKHVKLVLSDDGAGSIAASYADDSDPVTFACAYAASGEMRIEWNVVLNGRDMAADEFSLVLSENGQVLQRASADENGLAVFTLPLTSREAGTHTYTLTQEAGKEKGVVYDDSERTLLAEMTDDGVGHVTADVTGAMVPFENTYYSTDPLVITARITVDGKQLAGNEAALALYEGEKRIDEKRSDADGAVRFDPITYTARDAGEHSYLIRTSALSGGIENVTGDAEVRVTVLTDNAGNACPQLLTEEPVFGYTYTAEGSYTVTAQANVNGTAPGKEWSYTLYEGTEAVAEAQNDASGRIAFRALPLTMADIGEKRLTVRCVSEAPAGYTLDTETKEILLRVEDQGDGTLLAIPEGNAPVFSHSYAAAGSITPTCSLTMTGRALKEGEIRFGLYDGDLLLSESTNAADGLVSFTPVVFTHESAGEKALRIARIGELPAAVEWVGAESADVIVTVADQGDGTMKLSMSTPAFLCAYHAAGEISVQAKVVLVGRDIRDSEWTLDLMENGTVIDTVVCGPDGLAVFKTIETDEKGTMERVYTIAPRSLPSGVSGPQSAEVRAVAVNDDEGHLVWTCSENPVLLSYTYSAVGHTEIPVTVNTVYALSGGEFTVALFENGVQMDERQTDAEGKAVFNLDYAAGMSGTHTYIVRQTPGSIGGMTYDLSDKQISVDVNDDGKGTITCTVTGDASFTNEYEAKGAFKVAAKVVCEGFDVSTASLTVRLSENGTVIAEAQTDAEGNAWLGPCDVGLSDVGVHEMAVSVVSGVYSGMQSDKAPVVVTVTDQKNGSLTAETDREVYQLSASYSAEGTAEIAFDVNIDGKTMEEGMLTYALNENGARVSEASNDAAGRVTFTVPYTQTQTGKHTYQISNCAQAPGIAPDTQVYTVETLVKDDGTGRLITEVYLPENGISVQSAYSAVGELVLKASVELEGRKLEENEFLFAVYKDGAMFRQGRNDAAGNVLFETVPMTLSDVGTHVFTVQQVETGIGGVTYDSTVWQVNVSAADNGDGTLAIEADQNPVFRNTYTSRGSAGIVAYVHLTGRALSEGSFTLDLSAEDGSLLQEKTNDAGGTVKFDPISYDLSDVGVHRYGVRISATVEAGVVPDDHTETILVTVSDQGDGSLSVVIANNGPVFQNAFVAEDTLVLRPRVVINGGSVDDESLTLLLQDREGNTLETLRAAEGVSAFSPIAFTQDDAGKRYVYTVSCQETSAYYTVEVQVEDTQDGELGVNAVYTGSDGPVESLLFVWERTVDLTIRSMDTNEELGYRVSLYLDDAELMGDYPCSGAYEGTLSSDSVLSIPASGEVTISGLPADTRYHVACVAVPRYRADTVEAQGILNRSAVCEFHPEAQTVDYTVRFTVENNGTESVVPDPAALTLFGNGTALNAAFTQEGDAFAVRGLPAGGLEGGEIVYTAAYRGSDTLSVYYEHEDATYQGAVNGSVIRLIGGVTMSLRLRFALEEEGMYEYRQVTVTLYNEEGLVGTYVLQPDENGWCVITGLEKDHVYYAIAETFTGYSAVYRNAGQYGNVINRVYDGGTVTYQKAAAKISKRTVALIGGGSVAAVAGTVLVVNGVRKRRRRKSMDDSDAMDI